MTVILQIKIMLYVDNKVVLTTLIHFLQLQIVKALARIHFFLCTPMGLRGTQRVNVVVLQSVLRLRTRPLRRTLAKQQQLKNTSS